MKKTIVFILLSMVIHCSTAWAEETMTWLVTNWPPLQMLEGPDKGKGRYDAFMELYREHLPQYEHKTIEMNWSRFWTDIKEGKNVCSIFAVYSKDRAEFAEYSELATVGIPLRIVMRQSDMEKLGNPESISLIDLLEDDRFKGTLVNKRSYFAILDPILEEHHRNIKRISVSDKNLIRMILSGRTDYTLEYSYVANYLAEKYKTEYDTKIGSIAIKELPPVVSAYLACPKNEWGKKVIKDFNAALSKLKHTKEYFDIHLMYQSGPNEIDAITEGYQKLILKKD